VRLALLLLVLTACGKQLNPDFCAAHPSDDRCTRAEVDARVETTIDASGALDALASACPTTYVVQLSGQSSRYRVVDTANSWKNAEADCADDSMTSHLLVVSSAAELAAVAVHVDRDRYVGHSDKLADGAWRRVTDEPDTYPALAALSEPPWGAGEPNEGTSGDVAALAAADQLLHDRDGSEVQAYICECDAYAEDGTHF